MIVSPDLQERIFKRHATEKLKFLITQGAVTWSRNPDSTIRYHLPYFGSIDPLDDLLISAFFETEESVTGEVGGARQPSHNIP